MAFIRVVSNDAGVRRKLRALARAMSPQAQDMILKRVAWVWHGRMVQRTPKRWTGATRRGWIVLPISRGTARGYRVSNGVKTMIYLEKGTRPHGPKKAKRLFIPLTRKAAQAGARGVIAQLQMERASREQGQRMSTKFKPGVDFVFTKWVKGIKAMRIVESAIPFMRLTLTSAMRQFILAVINHA